MLITLMHNGEKLVEEEGEETGGNMEKRREKGMNFII